MKIIMILIMSMMLTNAVYAKKYFGWGEELSNLVIKKCENDYSSHIVCKCVKARLESKWPDGIRVQSIITDQNEKFFRQMGIELSNCKNNAKVDSWWIFENWNDKGEDGECNIAVTNGAIVSPQSLYNYDNSCNATKFNDYYSGFSIVACKKHGKITGSFFLFDNKASCYKYKSDYPGIYKNRIDGNRAENGVPQRLPKQAEVTWIEIYHNFKCMDCVSNNDLVLMQPNKSVNISNSGNTSTINDVGYGVSGRYNYKVSTKVNPFVGKKELVTCKGSIYITGKNKFGNISISPTDCSVTYSENN